MKIYRGMRFQKSDGLPKVGPKASNLGVRPNYTEQEIDPEDRIKPGDRVVLDIDVDANGMVQPGMGGMSTNFPPMDNIPPHRRPPKHGGDDPDYEIYELDTKDLPEGLTIRKVPHNPERQAYVEPAREMSINEYQHLLEDTRALWTRVP